MKYLYRSFCRHGLFASNLLVLLFLGTTALSQDRVFMYLDYFQNADNDYLVCEVKYRDENRQFLPIQSIEIELYQMLEDEEVLLTSVITGPDGKAKFDLEETDVNRDSLGRAVFESRFAGNTSYRSADKDVSTKRAKLEISLNVVDSVKQVTIEGFEINQRNTVIPEADIQLFVKRTYSDLSIAEGSLEDGIWEVDFPNDIPGDPFGNLSIIARVSEHDEYGTIEVKESVQWGTLAPIDIQWDIRALWGRPPIWILVAVFTALGAAWVHYFLAIYNLRKIRRT